MAKIDEKDIKTDENGIKLYRPEDFEGMRRAGKLAAECLDYITDFVDVGGTSGQSVPGIYRFA